MFASHSVRFGVPLLAGFGALSLQQPIKNETKRKFYEDESHVVPVPGTVTEASGTELEILGKNYLVDGISVRSSEPIEGFFKRTREFTLDTYYSFQEYLNSGYTSYYSTERQVTDTFSQLHTKSEDLLPNSIYILVATLSGNIFARQRGIVAKATFPIIFGLASFKYFLPQTFTNTTSFVWKLEKQNLPEIAEQQEKALEQAENIVQKIEETSKSSKKSLNDSVHSLRKSIAKVTGLNFDEDVSKK